MKKLTIVTRHFYPFTRPSGPVSLLREMVLALKRADVEVTVLSLRRKGEKDRYKFESIPVMKYDSSLVLSYRKALKESAPDHILFYSSISGFNELYMWWAAVSALSRVKLISFYQTTTFCDPPPRIRLPTRSLLRSFSHVFSASEPIQKYFSEHADLKSKLLHPGIDISSIKQRETPKDLNTIGFFGHIAQVKGIGTFLKIIEKRQDLSFIICAGASKDPGDRDVQEQTARACKKNKNLSCHDYVEDPLKIMKQCDLIILPYETGGSILGVAQTAIEAMALGIPIIGTKNDSLTPIIKDGTNGFLAENLNEILAKVDILMNNPLKYQELSKNARKTIEGRFNIDNSVEKLIKHIS